ncbi:hypothetical protein JMJ35_005968 [Cladonia borealis]|uniref:Uncharacterized protein n=1 Tax=Cladonia borealis TaxID=184061 RepID=A0AA39V809_9LECA|nr:hypothetical protein JMJ35_005968 [Cladonia borealis]
MTTAVDPSAMKQYLWMLERSISDEPLGVDEYSKTFTHIVKHLCLDPKPNLGQWTLKSSEWNLSRRREQWFQVLTGLTKDTLDQPKESRQFSLYDLGPRISVDYWGMYIDLLRVLVGESAVYQEYLRFKQIQQPSQIPAHQTVNPNLDIAKYLLNVTVRAIAEENLCFAYAVAQQHMNSLGDIEPSTWQVLLADLDLFYTWAPKMLPKAVNAMVRKFDYRVSRMEDRMLHTTALSELEYQLQEVEHELGVHWSGGESGYHAPSKTGVL